MRGTCRAIVVVTITILTSAFDPVLAPTLAFAEPIDGASLTVQSNLYNSSDNLEHQNSKVIFLQQGKTGLITAFGADAEMMRGEDDTTQYDGTKLTAMLAGQFVKGFGYSVAAGIHRLRLGQQTSPSENAEPLGQQRSTTGQPTPSQLALNEGPESQHDEQTIPYYEAILYAEPTPQFEAQLKTQNDYIYNDWIDAAAVGTKLTARKTALSAEFTPHERHSLRTDTHYAAFNDGNSQTYADAAYYYALIDDKHLLRLGPGATYYAFAKTREDFVLAKHYTSWSLRTEAELNLTQEISATLNLNAGRGREDNEKQNYEYWAEIKLVYSEDKAFNINLSYARLAADRPGDKWNRNDITLALSTAL